MRWRDHGRSRAVTRQRGVALAIVVWFIAGMSLLVAGIVAEARVDSRMAQLHVARAKAVAAGDGAIQLMMADLLIAQSVGGELPQGNYRLGDIEVRVLMVPSVGLVDLNSAPAEVLAALFGLVGGLDEDGAWLLAQGVVESRGAGPGQGSARFDAVEDLLRVPGASRALLDAVRDFIAAGGPGQGATDWALAPEALQQVLAKTDPAQADSVRVRRGSAAASYPGTAGAQTAGQASAYRADAIVRYGDTLWLRRRWVAIGTNPATALPWYTTRTEPPRVLAQDSYLAGGSADA